MAKLAAEDSDDSDSSSVERRRRRRRRKKSKKSRHKHRYSGTCPLVTHGPKISGCNREVAALKRGVMYQVLPLGA